jgi:hypothetical protein
MTPIFTLSAAFAGTAMAVTAATAMMQNVLITSSSQAVYDRLGRSISGLDQPDS